MRKAMHDKKIIIIDGKFIGISLGSDYCAEHEWGISGLKRLFGIPDRTKKNLGVKSRTITKKVENIVFRKESHKKESFAILYTSRSWTSLEEAKDRTPYDLDKYKSEILWKKKYDFERKEKEVNFEVSDFLATAWDGEGFGVGVMGDDNVKYLEELYSAIQNCNLTIAPMNSTPDNPFSNASLSLLITDRIPKEFIDGMYTADKEAQDLIDYEKKIGMTKFIKKYGNKNDYHGHGYFMACSPKWIDYEDEEARESEKKKNNTKYNIMYWINYSDDDHNYGWYTVEKIREWLKGDKKLTELDK